MVEMRKSGGMRPESELAAKCRDELPVKLEIVEDDLEEEHGPLNKRSKLWSSGTSSLSMAPAKYNPLDEPSPLGLSLRKSPSLLELIQRRLAENGDPKSETLHVGAVGSGLKRESKGITAASVGATLAPGSIEKLKASNFPASLLKIGQWEYKSRYEGDLVAKCYFAKHKLVWEVLEKGLKSKIEIQWSDIMALKANCPEDGPGTLTLVLARQPLFFRETNPQPRKHTLWQATSDFTDGQASMNRQHFLQCAQGIMNKHFEKLVQCDHRLFHLSRQPEIVVDSPYFDSRQSIFEDPSESKGHPYGLNTGPSISGTHNLASPAGAQSSSEHMYLSHEAPSPSSVIDARANEGIGGAEAVNSRNTMDCRRTGVPGIHQSMSLSDFLALLSDPNNTTDSSQVGEVAGVHQSMSVSDFVALLSDSRNITESSQIKVPGLQQSMSVSDFVGLLSDSAGGNFPEHMEQFENMKQQLLSDSIQFDTADEKSLMPRVNSLFNLLYKDPNVAANSQLNSETSVGLKSEPSDLKGMVSDNNNNNRVFDPASSSKPQGMLRKDSFSDLLLHLPRITSLPKFLSNISEEDGDAYNR
uniref:TRF2/HOY1 PH-like domain-containing protein n=1 Tax=Noccaea caerulescens TaxID=107243 RepID=A0A1J3GQA7_NOCCA